MNLNYFFRKLVKEHAAFATQSIALLGISDKRSRYQLEEVLQQEESANVEPGTLILSGSLDRLEEIREHASSRKRFISLIEQLEETHDLFCCYGGEGDSAVGMNLALLANYIVVVVNDSPDAWRKLKQFLEVFSKLGQNTPFGVIVDTSSPTASKEQFNKLQEFTRQRLNYYIELIGFVELKYIPLTQGQEQLESLVFERIWDMENPSPFSEQLLRYI